VCFVKHILIPLTGYIILYCCEDKTNTFLDKLQSGVVRRYAVGSENPVEIEKHVHYNVDKNRIGCAKFQHRYIFLQTILP